ncbi:MAG: hypothetical protein ACP5N1_01315 [Candidatus Woesearchaeota archaeon]
MKSEQFIKRMNEEIDKLVNCSEFKSKYLSAEYPLITENKLLGDQLSFSNKNITGIFNWTNGIPHRYSGRNLDIDELKSIGLLYEIRLHNKTSSGVGDEFSWGVFRDFSGIPETLETLENMRFGNLYGIISSPNYSIKTDFEKVIESYGSGPKKESSLEESIEYIIKSII